VLEGLRPLSQPDLFTPRPGADEPDEDISPALRLPPSEGERERIAEALSQVPAEIDEIIRHTGIAAATVYLVLLELDLAGRLQRHAGGGVSIVPE
jgi:DNA processing protein